MPNVAAAHWLDAEAVPARSRARNSAPSEGACCGCASRVLYPTAPRCSDKGQTPPPRCCLNGASQSREQPRSSHLRADPRGRDIAASALRAGDDFVLYGSARGLVRARCGIAAWRSGCGRHAWPFRPHHCLLC
eukprot:Amastigsp_a175743_247.p4 type:complete len:133 gc:universal Amastigsp_a175743_247:1504-1106(-)